MFRLFPLFSFLLLLSGCMTHQEQIEDRIKQKPEALAVLDGENQDRIRKGQLKPGDPKELAWYVYGDPVRRFTKSTEQGKMEIWSYTQTEFDPNSRATYPVMRPVRTGSGHTVWVTDNYMVDSEPRLRETEVLRIEFKDGKINSIESMVNP